jgi:hypothetical protein
MRTSKLQEKIKELELVIALNQMLPAGLRCDAAIAQTKKQLAQLKRGPILKVVPAHDE